MGWKDVVHKAKVAAGVDEDKSVADEAAEELARQETDGKGGEK